MTSRSSEHGRGIGGMSRCTAARAAWSVCALSLLLMAFGIGVMFVGWSTPLSEGWNPWRNQAIETLGIIGAPVLGGLIASRRPENTYGWLWLGVGMGWAFTSFAHSYAVYALVVAPGSLPAPRTVGVLVESVGFVGVITLAPFLLLLFPDGRLPSRRWRLLAWSIITVGALLAVSYPISTEPTQQFVNPIGIGGTIGEVMGFIAVGVELVLYGAILLSALSLVLRYRRAGREERQQLKWFAYAGVFVSAYLLPGFFLTDFLDSLLGTIVLLGLYAAIAIAILKHHLYDIDLVINRTLVYGSLTVVIAGVLQAIDAAVHHLFLTVTGQESWLGVIVSALVIAALFEPLKRRIKHFVDRRVFRKVEGEQADK
jgi:hypothetical protein